jgi:hypothetical protein
VQGQPSGRAGDPAGNGDELGADRAGGGGDRHPPRRADAGARPGCAPDRLGGGQRAINGRLEHLRGSALGFRNLTNYIARSLLESGGFSSDPDYTQDCDELEVLATDITSLITTPRLTSACAQLVSKTGSNWYELKSR